MPEDFMPAEQKNWLYAAGVIWPTLTQTAQDGTTLRYKDLGVELGIHHRVVRWALGPIQDYCLETKRPPLTVLVVGVNHRPGGGFIAWDLDDFDSALEAVYSYNWNAVVNPFKHLGPDDFEHVLVDQLLDAPDRSEAVYRQMPDRGVAQRLFRIALLQAYEGQCAFCRCSFEDALEAAHIVPWARATPAQRLDVRNGLLLCATHHRMFDAALIAPTSNHAIQFYDPDQADGSYSQVNAVLSFKLHGRKLNLPADKRAWPSVQLIEERRRLDEW